jgi:hypothetical protein
MVEYINRKGTEICKNLYDYSLKWKQPINVKKTVVQLFHTQVDTPEVQVFMGGKELECVKKFKYLGFEWTDKLSLTPTIEHCLEKIKSSYIKLKWLKRNKKITTEVLRLCFFAFSFPFFAWIFPFFPLLPTSHQLTLNRKFRVGLRMVHRCPFITAHEIPTTLKERPLESYVTRYLQKRLNRAFKSDLGESLFYNDLFMWDHLSKEYEKQKQGKIRLTLKIGHYLRLARIKKMIERHESFIVWWIQFIVNHSDKEKYKVLSSALPNLSTTRSPVSS